MASWTGPEIRLYTNANVNYTDIRSNNGNQLKTMVFPVRDLADWCRTFPQDFRVGANAGIFSGRQVQLQTTQSAFYFYSFNVMKSFLNKKLDVNLSNQSFTEFVEFSSKTKGEGFMQESTFMQPMRLFVWAWRIVSAIWNFHQEKVQRTISNDDVKAGESASLPEQPAVQDLRERKRELMPALFLAENYDKNAYFWRE